MTTRPTLFPEKYKLNQFAKGSPFGKDSLRPEGDVALATKGGCAGTKCLRG